jgi:hypothetical protein
MSNVGNSASRPVIWRLLKVCIYLCALLLTNLALAQEVEPRRWAPLPVGANFIGLGYGHTSGDIYVNPTLLLEDGDSSVDSFGLAYIRGFGMFGQSSRLDIKLPYASGHWDGMLDGNFIEADRSGFGDPTIRLGVNLFGAPAAKPKEFAESIGDTRLSLGLKVTVPVGEYIPDKQINLGGNRWAFTPQIGLVHRSGKLTSEFTASVWLYGDNDKHNQLSRLEQEPLFGYVAYFVYKYRPKIWLGIGAAYATGGATTVDGLDLDDERGNFVWGLTVGYAFNRRNGIKIAYLNASTTKDIGQDFQSIQIGYSYMWGKDL